MSLDDIPYVCGDCGAGGVKLWRSYSMFLRPGAYKCADCTAVYREADISTQHPDGWLLDKDDRKTYIIGDWWVPAVQSLDDPEVIWGYTSIPTEDLVVWETMPLRNNND